MSRAISTPAKNAIFASQTDKAFLILIEITGGNIDTPIRATSDNVNTVSNGDTYSPFPFQISMPKEAGDEIPVTNFIIDNIDRTIITELRAATTPLLIELNIVLHDTPDTIEAGPFDYTLRNVDYDDLAISGDLMFEDILNEPYPADSYDPVNYPGLFE